MDSQSSKGKKPALDHDRSLADLPDGVISKIMACVGACNAKEVFRLRTLCNTFSRAVDSDEVYRQLSDDSLFPIWVINNMRKNRNPNMLFRDGMNKFFSLGDEAAGKEMMQQASDLGQVDATFVLGMLEMGQGKDRQAEAKQMLTSARTRLAAGWDVPRTANKVRELLSDPCVVWRSRREYPNCILCCPLHKVSRGQTLRDAFVHRRPWLLDCNVCLWDVCYINFVAGFGIYYF